MFWDLKGATRYPSCLKIRHKPAAIKLFPALDMVPCIMIVFAIRLLPFCHYGFQYGKKFFIFLPLLYTDPIISIIKSFVIGTGTYQNFPVQELFI